ncbi:MAG TPA: hypothetical protein VID48_06520 [Solirubrobacteraceae bacterium]
MNCGAPLASDQRYCLSCGERRLAMSSVLLGGAPAKQAIDPSVGTGGSVAYTPNAGQHASAATVIAGVGVLLLAMGVGVLIGRSANTKQSAPAAPPVFTVAGSANSGTSTAAGATPSETPFSDDWPAGTNGYTVQLQSLPESTTQASAVQAAKATASGKGATQVGAVRSADFSSLSAGNYVIYSGVYQKKAEAQKALAALKKNFPAATVISVSSGSSSSSSASGSPPAGGTGSPGAKGKGHSAPSSAPASKPNSGQSFEQKSKNLPDVVETK